MVKTIATHNSNFHADDVFAVATLAILYPEFKVVRTRETEVIKKADIVVDVGMMYDANLGRFDHHQSGGAGVRENGIPYASFGLIWKHFGEKVTGSKSIAALIEHNLVLSIDALDNGVALSKPEYPGISEYNITNVINSFLPQDESENLDECFGRAVTFAKELILREVEGARREAEEAQYLRDLAARNAGDPVLILERFMRGKDVLIEFPGILFVVFPGRVSWGDDKWYVKTVRRNLTGFESKKLLPEEWAGKVDRELAQVSGVSDAVFCHRGRFIAAARSKEGAVGLARKALEA